MKRLKTYFYILFSCMCVAKMPLAQALLDLQLTQGMRAAIPIAVVSFRDDAQALAPGDATVTQIIQEDLQNSGEFAVKKFPNDAGDWRAQGVNDVVKGSVTSMGGDRYQVSFQLAGVYNQGSLASQSFVVPKSALRRVAHHISDIVFEKLIGVRGIFNTRVAYVIVQRMSKGQSHYTLEIADMDGFNPQPLLTSIEPIMSPAWSPDGHKLAYVSFEGEHAGIYLQNLASGQRQLLANYPGINGAPAFSPDGSKLAMVLTLTGNPKVYIMDLATRKLTQVTQGYSIDTEPAWAPDGRSLIYTSSAGGTQTPQIYRYDLAAKQASRVTFSGNYNARASFLPDQKGIVMMHRDGGNGEGFGIAYEDFASGRTQVLTETGSDDSPSVAPNGKMVIYSTNYNGRGVLGVVSIDGGIKLRLPAREGEVQSPAWSPFLG
jgi:TolB protein